MSLALSLCALVPHGDAFAQSRDAAGSKDHPLIKRFEGTTILGYEFSKFNDLVLLLGPVKGEARIAVSEYENGRWATPLTATNSQRVEGELTRILYLAPKQRAPLEVMRNYERELLKSGFQTLFKCSREECSQQDGVLGHLYLYPHNRRLKNTLPLSPRALSYATDQHFMSAKRASAGADTYVSLYVAKGGFDEHKETFEHPVVLLEVVETVPMENKMVTVDAATMAKEMAKAGHVALYGIYFDNNKTDLKPESANAIGEIVKFLKSDPRILVYIVGHTDNVGGYEYNLGLSQRRAEAVVKDLTSRHGIPAGRLRAAGTGALAPVAPNDTEDGRAKNRRVELVKQ